MKRRGSLFLAGNVLWLSVVSLLNDAASEMIYPLLPLFVVGTLGASTTLLGVIEGIAESVASLLKLVSGHVSDRMRVRKPLILGGYGIAALARPLVALAAAPWHVLAIRFSDRVGKGLRSAPRDALLAASVPATHRGRAFGLHRAADHLGAVIGPLIASALLLVFVDRLRLVFALAVVPGVLSLLVIVWMVREATPTAADGAGGPTTDTSDIAVADAPGGGTGSVALRPFLLALFVFTLGNATDAFLLLRAGDLGVPVAAIPLLWAALHVSKSAFSVAGGSIADRFGTRPAIVAGWLLYAAVYAGFAAATSAWHAWALFLAYGLFYGLTEAPEKALVAALAPAAGRGAAFGAYHFVIGIGALPASVLFGWTWQQFGAEAAFLLGAGIALVAAALLTMVRPPRVDVA